MNAILEQLELNRTFFYQLALFAALFLLLRRVYFRPFLKLIELRHRRTTEDRETAEKLGLQAQERLEEYRRRMGEERAAARAEYDRILEAAKKEEAAILAAAREQAKRITQEAVDSVTRQRDDLKKQLELEVEVLARNISERLISRKV